MENVIVITGGSRGIGAATALLAARQGYRICINYHADDQAAENILDQVRALGAEAIAVRADASVEDEIIQLFQRVDAELGPVTALVNNAGTIGQQSRVEDMSEFRLLKVMKTNVVGPMLCAKHALLRMARRHGGQGGAIVNVSSVAARLGSPNEYVDYAASKGALDTFTIGLAKEVAGEGVRVNGVRPGYIHTGFHALSGDPDRVSKLEPGLPMGAAGAQKKWPRPFSGCCRTRPPTPRAPSSNWAVGAERAHQPSSRVRTRSANTSSSNGLVSTKVPRSSWPSLSAALSS
ncbi:hypothetical protein GLGCALEP_02863 [Pseudomonas sp. MM221]|nr:hypothetical protein GLGCALEP_02863 [Pseudomonas sp. MM221]